jgi:hypothetical protein
MTAMSVNSSQSRQSARAATVPSLDLRNRLSRLYELAQNSDYLFGSPLGPIMRDTRTLYLPQFVYFGPKTSEASPRLAVISGLGRHDLLAARAVTAFVEGLARNPDIGHALNISFFPVANVLGLMGGAEEHELSDEHWANSHLPEIRLLAQDARTKSYQGYIRIITTSDDEPSALLRTVVSTFTARSDIEVLNSDDFSPWNVTFAALSSSASAHGPLSMADDLPFAPFEVELSIPAEWSQARADREIAAVLKRLVIRYRGFLAYGQNL